MWKKLAAATMAALMLMGSAAQAELVWTQDFPQMPHTFAPAYRAQENPQLFELAEAAIEALALDAGAVDRSQDSIWAQRGTEESGEREVLRCDASALHYSLDTRRTSAMGDLNANFKETETFVDAMLGTDAFTQHGARVVEYAGDGKIATNVYDFVWDKHTPEGVVVHDLRLAATFRDGGVQAVHLWDALLEATERDAVYACPTAQEALAHLNYAIAHIDPAHACTSFDDPADTLAQIYPVYTQMFSQEGIYTPAWAFVLRDAQHGALKTPVLVDMESGDVWDYHDGRLRGAQ